MTAKLIKPSGHEEITERWHQFEWEDCPGAGFHFTLDENGNHANDNDMARKNFAMCKTGEDERGKKIIDHGIQSHTRTVYNPPVYQCECGKKVYGDGDNQCGCGRWYNAGGQELDAHAMVCSVYANGFDCMCGENDE